jgi:hypothetical protein
MFVGGQDADPTDIDVNLINEALRAAPPEALDGGLILPHHSPTGGTCRLCGAQTTLSREHVPPRSAGNSDRVRFYTINENSAASLSMRFRVASSSRAVSGASLCADHATPARAG